jgi:RND family efflux transporter MFP subunit
MCDRLIISFFASCVLILVGCNRQKVDIAEPPPLVRVLQTSQINEEAVELRGSVVSRERLRLGFKAPGILKAVRVREGDRVKAGQVLALLDDLDAQSQSTMVLASLERARREADRTSRLVKEGALPASLREDTRNQLESAEASWKQAEDGVRRTRILAPISGTVFQRLAEPGEAVGAGVPVLVLDSTDRTIIRTGISEQELTHLKVGQDVQVLDPASPPRRARISSVAAAPGEDGLYAVEIESPGGAWRPGTLVQVRVPFVSKAEMIRIPFSALVNRQGQDYVVVLHPEAGAIKVRMRPVRVVA